MATGLRTPKNGKRDRHDWNTYENYKQVHDTCLANHPFVNHSKCVPPSFELIPVGEFLVVRLQGIVECHGNVAVAVNKVLKTKMVGSGRIQVRGLIYCYHANITGGNPIFRYDNGHDIDDYHKHVYDIDSGTQIDRKSLTRNEFPTLSGVLD